MITNKERLEEVRKLLRKETVRGYRPILHNEDRVMLLFWGWEIVLNDDGTWYWSDTTGG
mgnify:CR=1 FL=1